MKKTLLLILWICLSNMARAQAPTAHFNPHEGSEAYAYNSSGNYLNASGKFSLNENVSGNRAGFNAQELETIIKKINDNFNGVNAPQNANDHYNIRYAEFVLPLVKAVQELTGLVDKQNKEILELKRQIVATRTEVSTAGKIAGSNRIAWLSQNYSNPSSPETEIGVSLPDGTTNANLVFYTLEGKQLKLLHLYNRGDFTVKIDRNDLTRGICFYALMIDGKIIDSKQLIVK